MRKVINPGGSTSNEPSTLRYHGSFEALDLVLNDGFQRFGEERKGILGTGTKPMQILRARKAQTGETSSEAGKEQGNIKL